MVHCANDHLKINLVRPHKNRLIVATHLCLHIRMYIRGSPLLLFREKDLCLKNAHRQTASKNSDAPEVHDNKADRKL